MNVKIASLLAATALAAGAVSVSQAQPAPAAPAAPAASDAGSNWGFGVQTRYRDTANNQCRS